ncbi:flagellin [Weizmannia sp. FSL W8-0401]|uniref:flagellin n=1 Tax=Weizmannia sp. FSL W8-0401 TaxID=2954554 RepID=UPI004047A912
MDEAIKKVSTERANLGAFENRLEHTVNNLTTSSENLTSAESRIRDVDYALAA